MQASISPILRVALLLFPALWWPLAGHAERVEPLRYDPLVAKSATDTAAFVGAGGQSFTLDLSTLAIDDSPAVDGVRKTGSVHFLAAPVAAEQLAWEAAAGGYVAHIRVASSQARRLRFHIAGLDPASPVQFRVQGTLDPAPFGPIGQSAFHDGEAWLPISNGEGAELEIFVDALLPQAAPGFRLDAVNLIATAPPVSASTTAGIVPKGKAQYPEYDLACWTNNTIYAGLTQAADATAMVNFISGSGSYQCTGTLLNDTGNTRTPWFTTANHCIHTQSAANSASFEWFYRVTSCNGSQVDPRYTQTFDGARLLWTDFNFEASFLKLNSPPPAGAVFIGWDTNIKVGDPVWGVHHPEGDHLKASQGRVTALLQTEHDSVQGGTHLLDSVQFSLGGTEAGSSGSGLFALANGTAYWKGTLFGGPADDYQAASYSHLGNYYDKIKIWLDPTPDPKTECLLAWAERQYPLLFYPGGTKTQYYPPYFYRYYWFTNSDVGVSTANNHVYYMGPDRVLQDEGDWTFWLTLARCS